MGQKINPIGLRLGINRTWDSRWYANTGEYGKLLHEDVKIREFLTEELKQAAISKIVIERPHKKCRVTIHSARPGIIIGKKGADIEKLRKKLSEMTNADTSLNIVEVRKPEIDATLIAQSIGLFFALLFQVVEEFEEHDPGEKRQTVEVAIQPLVLAHDVARGLEKAPKHLRGRHRCGVCAVLLLNSCHRAVLAGRSRPGEAHRGRRTA